MKKLIIAASLVLTSFSTLAATHAQLSCAGKPPVFFDRDPSNNISITVGTHRYNITMPTQTAPSDNGEGMTTMQMAKDAEGRRAAIVFTDASIQRMEVTLMEEPGTQTQCFIVSNNSY